MSFFHSLDTALFHFVNGTLSNPVFDKLMPFVSGNPLFIPVIALVVAALLWKGGKRAWFYLFFILLVIAVGDGWICNSLKHAIGRPRPFVEFPDAHLLLGRGKSNSMPSSHAANWFAATMVTFLFYRRSWRFMLPLACIVSFSRVYNGVHYPSDVLVGAILGAGYAAAMVLLVNFLWQIIGKRWFPIWWKTKPSLIEESPSTTPALDARPSTLDSHWLRLGYIFIFALFVFRLFYIASPAIQLSEDEAYQWVWSKHLALSYFSKPPFIAYTQFLGTTLWGDTEFGVRFFSPVIAAILSILLLRFLAREVNVRVALALVFILSITPLTAVGSILMTIDPLSVLFWVAAMLTGWRAVQSDGKTSDWIWTGIWMGCGFLSKYTNLFQLISWILVFLLWPASRKHLRKPGPYLALLMVALSLIPVLVWNSQHGWITIEHVANNGGIGHGKWKPTLKYFFDFLGAESGLLNPVFFIAMIVSLFAFWRTRREKPVELFLFCMGISVFFFYFAYSFHSRILPNWIAPCVIPLFALMIIHWEKQWQKNRRILKPLFIAGIIFGGLSVAILHETSLTQKIFKRTLPPQIDPLRRVRAWRETTRVVEAARRELAEKDGKPAFIIGDHYGITGEMSFYLPAARKQIQGDPFVFYRSGSHPRNQFYFWPGYESRKGQNAIYVEQIDLPDLDKGWIWKWLRGEKDLPVKKEKPPRVPPEISNQFESVTDLGATKIFYDKKLFRQVQLFECRNLLGAPK
jgi:membrane-associated phospholipid phosphatase